MPLSQLTNPVVTPPPLTSQQTVDRARAFLQSGQGSGLPELLELIQTLSSKLEEISLQELTDIIEKDAIILARILAAANTLQHNPGISRNTNIGYAIHQLGLPKVRKVALSMMLMENAAGAPNSSEQRAAAAQALCAGLIARSCANNLGYADPELLFACSILRNLGPVLLPAISLEHCREAERRTEKMTVEVAYRSMFGLTPLELSRKVVATMRMSEEVIYTLRDCQPETMGGVASQLNGRLLAIAEFSSQLAALALSPKSGTDGFIRHSRALAKRFDRILPTACELIDPALSHTHQQVGQLSKQGGFIPTQMFARIAAHVKPTTPAAPPSSAAAPAPAVSVAASVAGEDPRGEVAPVRPPASLADAPTASPPAPIQAVVSVAAAPAEDWAATLTQSTAFEAKIEPVTPAPAAAGSEDPWNEALSIIQELMQADHCALFIGGKGGRSVRFHSATKELELLLSAQIESTPGERTVIGVCLTRRETVLIHDTTDPALRTYLPEWMQAAGARPGAFLLLPLSEELGAEGFIYLAWKQVRKIAISSNQTALIRGVIGPLVIKLQKAQPSSAAPEKAADRWPASA